MKVKSDIDHLSKEILFSIGLAEQVGKKLISIAKTGIEIPTEIKTEDELKQHAIVTKADTEAQEIILKALSKFEKAEFLTEEKATSSNVITNENYKDIFQKELVFGIDPLDGTSQYKNGLYEWSSSIGVMKNGLHTGGVITAPAVRGGITIAGEKRNGVWLKENGDWGQIKTKRVPEIHDSIICIGPDIFLNSQYNSFLNKVSKEVRTTNCIGSCALGLTLVAAGRIDALIQPAHYPWDWFAGYPLVEEAGGKFQFYHYRDDSLIALEKSDIQSYCPSSRQTSFIAGNSKIVNWLWDILKSEWKK